jgi:hypothetical protein
VAFSVYFQEHPLQQLIKAGDEFYLADRSSQTHKFVCHKVRVVRDPSRSLMLHYVAEDGTVNVARKLSLKGKRLYIGAVGFSPQGKSLFSSGIGTHLRAVSEDKGSIGFVGFGASPEEDRVEVRYFAPYMLEWWDRELTKCQERAQLRNGWIE